MAKIINHLMQHIQSLETETAVIKKNSTWTQYKKPYFTLIDEKKKSPKEAIRIIASFEHLSADAETKLYNAQKQWKRASS